MTEQKPNSTSLTDQILDTLFASLESQDGFDHNLVERLRDLAKRDELTKPAKVAGVLKTAQGGYDEAH